MNNNNNNNNTQDESVSQFLSITGSVDVNQALSYLEMADNNLETAISLFLEHSSSGVTSNNTDHNTNHYNVDNTTDQVRAPDQTRRMRLMDFEDHDDQPSSSVGIPMGMFRDSQFSTFQDPFHSMGLESSFGGRIGIGGMNAFQTLDPNIDHDEIIHQEDTGIDSSSRNGSNPHNIIPNIRNLMNQVAAQEYNGQDNTNMMTTNAASTINNINNNTSTTTANARSLANLFQPPLHLIHTAGGFQGAKQVAKDTRRWLLVNLQSDEEFSCHALNRDVWRDELVENLIREGFVFWQTVRTTTLVHSVFFSMVFLFVSLINSFLSININIHIYI